MSRKTEPVQPSWWGALMHVHTFTHLGTLLRAESSSVQNVAWPNVSDSPFNHAFPAVRTTRPGTFDRVPDRFRVPRVPGTPYSIQS